MNKPNAEFVYNHVNKKIERMFKIIHRIWIEIGVPVLIFPSMVISGINYFVLNMGEDSFILPSPAMYVISNADYSIAENKFNKQ